MHLHQLFLTQNNCYKAKRTQQVKGIMVHSTGANNPNLRRYVGPDDGRLGHNPNNNHWNMAKPGGQDVCVHAFIGKLADGSIATYQTLPWNFIGWHSGAGVNGSANKLGFIGFEICEDDLTDPVYFNSVYQEAVELCVMLCKQYNLNPKLDIICHREGTSLGIASAHADVMHWFPKHGKSMKTFRKDVEEGMKNKDNSPEQYAAGVIERAVRVGIIKGDENGDLKLHSSVTRQDCLVFIDRALKAMNIK